MKSFDRPQSTPAKVRNNIDACSNPTPEIRRQLAEFARIFVDALIRIDAHGSRIGEPERPARQHPIVKQAEHEPLAQLELQGFDQPSLHHVEREQEPRDQEEDAELEEKVPQVAARQRIVERLVPAVEANLSVGGGRDDQHDGRQHQVRALLPTRRAEDRAAHEADLPPKPK